MSIGFTGTREGMTQEQKNKLAEILDVDGIVEFHHGDCVGSDEQAHQIAQDWGADIVVHPPSDPKLRAYVRDRGDWFNNIDVLLQEKPYLQRNRDIVDACDLLIACPKEPAGSHRTSGRGGTWYTINYALKVGKPVTIIWPDGSTS